MTSTLRRAVRTHIGTPPDSDSPASEDRSTPVSGDYDPRTALAEAREAFDAFQVDLPSAIAAAARTDLDEGTREALTAAAEQLSDEPDTDPEEITGLREVAAVIDAPSGFPEAAEALMLASGRVLYDLDGDTFTARSLDVETGEVTERTYRLGSAADLPREAAAESIRMQRRLLGQLERSSERARAQEEALARTEAARTAQIRALRRIGVGINEIAEAAGVSNSYVYARTRTQKESEDADAAREKRKLPSTYKTAGPGVGVTEAARRLGLSEAGVRLRVRNGKLASTTYKGRLRVLLDED